MNRSKAYGRLRSGVLGTVTKFAETPLTKKPEKIGEEARDISQF
jgi:hypothetical protein